MKKKIIILLLLVLLLGIVFVGIVVLNNSKSSDDSFNKELNKLINKKIKHGDYLKIKYYSTAGVNGNIDEKILDIKNKTYITKFSASEESALTTTKFSVSDKSIKSIIDILNKYNLVAFSTLKIDKSIEDTKGVTYIDIVCSSGGKDTKTFKIDFNYKFPDGGYDLVRKLYERLDDLDDYDNLIEENIGERE